MVIKTGEISFEDENRQSVRDLFGEAYERRVHGESLVLTFLADVKRLMNEKGIKQTDLARALDADKGQVSRWLSARTGIRAATMFTLADALGYQLEVVWRPICSEWGSSPQVTIETAPVATSRVSSSVVSESIKDVNLAA